jgi:hypothetical protein
LELFGCSESEEVSYNLKVIIVIIMFFWISSGEIYAEVVTFVAGSLEAGGLPRYPEVF